MGGVRRSSGGVGLEGTVGTQGPEWGIGTSVALGTPRECRGLFGGIRGVEGVRVYWGLAGTLGTQGPEGV